jgi:hypothetical protein
MDRQLCRRTLNHWQSVVGATLVVAKIRRGDLQGRPKPGAKQLASAKPRLPTRRATTKVSPYKVAPPALSPFVQKNEAHPCCSPCYTVVTNVTRKKEGIMKTLGVRELKERISEILRMVQEK